MIGVLILCLMENKIRNFSLIVFIQYNYKLNELILCFVNY